MTRKRKSAAPQVPLLRAVVDDMAAFAAAVEVVRRIVGAHDRPLSAGELREVNAALRAASPAWERLKATLGSGYHRAVVQQGARDRSERSREVRREIESIVRGYYLSECPGATPEQALELFDHERRLKIQRSVLKRPLFAGRVPIIPEDDEGAGRRTWLAMLRKVAPKRKPGRPAKTRVRARK